MRTYIKFLTRIYLISFLNIFLIAFSLIFILNLLTELDFFKDINVSTYFPIYLSLLNTPSLIFEMFPFIFLIATQLFFHYLGLNFCDFFHLSLGFLFFYCLI